MGLYIQLSVSGRQTGHGEMGNHISGNGTSCAFGGDVCLEGSLIGYLKERNRGEKIVIFY